MNPSVAQTRRPGSHQRGMVLVISLLMLLVLTLIGLAATRSTTLEQRMTINQNDQEVAFEAAEAALRDGESTLSGASSLNFASNAGGAYTQGTTPVTWENINWNNTAPTTGAVIGYSGGIQPIPATRPSYFIMLTGISATGSGSSLSSDQPLPSATVYYIYARGVGVTGNTSVVLQSTFEVGG